LRSLSCAREAIDINRNSTVNHVTDDFDMCFFMV